MWQQLVQVRLTANGRKAATAEVMVDKWQRQVHLRFAPWGVVKGWRCAIQSPSF